MEQFNKPFIDFYKRHNISPVSQDISDLDRHFDRRLALYRLCGIPYGLVQNKDILEFGPGTGHNALVSNALGPASYVLVDGNPTSIRKTTELLNRYFADTSNCSIIESEIEKFSTDKKFDMVMCEGTIPFQSNPKKFLNHVAGFVKPGGVLLITCIDPVSYLSETLRRVLSKILLKNSEHLPIEDQLALLRPVFGAHLSTLEGMSRPVDDWIYDNMLQPFIGEPLSIEEAVSSLDKEFDAYGSSPDFLTDWRWYKDIVGEKQKYNELAIHLYKQNVHNLMDYQWVSEPVAGSTGDDIIRICNHILDTALKMDQTGVNEKSLKIIVKELKSLDVIIGQLKMGTAAAVDEFIKLLEDFLAHDTLDLGGLNRFAAWFGRGQQYLSFIRKSQVAKKIQPVPVG